MGGGYLDEHALDSAKRELVQQTGIAAARWEPLSKVLLSNSVFYELGHIYLAKELTFGVTQFD